MTRIKGKYVATVVVDLDFELNDRLLSLDEIKNAVLKEFTPFLEHLIQGEIDPYMGKVEVKQNYANVYNIEEDS